MHGKISIWLYIHSQNFNQGSDSYFFSGDTIQYRMIQDENRNAISKAQSFGNCTAYYIYKEIETTPDLKVSKDTTQHEKTECSSYSGCPL